MTKLIHLSDLHFGTHDDIMPKQLAVMVNDLAPDFCIISGDFTQIGSKKEFKQAGEFIDSIKAKVIAVPGNHDISARNLTARFFRPYKNYRSFISSQLCPIVSTEDMIIVGLNSARNILLHWNWANGAINAKQLDLLEQAFEKAQHKWRICVLHHPIHKVQEMPINVTVFGRKKTLQTFTKLQTDLVLTGHVHHASVATIGTADYQTVYLSASTALSSRKRGQENGFNLIDLDDNKMAINVYKYENSGFQHASTYEHQRRKTI